MATAEVEIVCDSTASFCLCSRTDEHDLHRCICGGEWRGGLDGNDFEAVTLPKFPVGPRGDGNG